MREGGFGGMGGGSGWGGGLVELVACADHYLSSDLAMEETTKGNYHKWTQGAKTDRHILKVLSMKVQVNAGVQRCSGTECSKKQTLQIDSGHFRIIKFINQRHKQRHACSIVWHSKRCSRDHY